MVNLKVNGIVEMKQLRQLDGLAIEFAGFDFFRHSPRHAAEKIKSSELKSSDFDIRKVGIFINSTYDEIMKTMDEYGLDIAQLSGDESATFCEKLSRTAEVIKGFKTTITKGSVQALIEEYDGACDYYLFETSKQTEWKQLTKSSIEKPFFLGGHIGPGDVMKLKEFDHPDLFGFDINEQFETSVAVKDMVSILQFKQGLKKK